jgi:HAD superfamily hydrolase (TIGR01490 family)
VKTAAFFDIDGTLIRGFIIQSFPRYLADHGLIDQVYSRRINNLIEEYRRATVSYRHAFEESAKIYAEAIKSLQASVIQEAAREYGDYHLNHSIFHYTKDLIEIARRRFDLLIAISGSPEEPLHELHHLGFYNEYGSVFEAQEGIFTGKIVRNMILGEVKAMRVQELAIELDVDLNHSASFGNSDQDIPVMDLTRLQIVINPIPEMKRICDKRSWKYYETDSLKLKDIENTLKRL